MTLPDYPPGEWSVLLVGAQWVSIASVTAVNTAVANRGTIQANFTQLHDSLQNAITTTLTGQEGAAADAIRDAFRQGADQAAQIAEKNGTYKNALQDALNSVQHLREKLTNIARDGNQQINDILKSSDKFDTKVIRIAHAIAEHQRQANQAAGECAFSITGAGQKVVDAQGTGQSFFGMANDTGIDVNRQPNEKGLEDQVREMLNQPGGPMAGNAGNTVPAALPSGGPMAANAGNTVPAVQPPATPAPALPMAGSAGNSVPATEPPAAPAPALPMAGGAANAVSGGATPAARAPFMGGAPSAGAGLPISGAPMSGAPMAGMPAGLAGANPIAGGPPGLNNALPTSAPMSAGAGGLPGGPVQAVQPQLPPTAPTIPAAATGTPVTAGDAPAPTPQAPAPTAAPSAAFTSESASPMMSAPAATPVAASVPPAPAGPLPGYGTDLRPPAAAMPTPQTPSVPSSPIGQPPSSVSGSAPVHPSAGGAAGVGQPAVARQPGLPTPAPSPPGVGTQAVIATAGGALAGSVSADATARTRLQRILSAVARQQPRLAWAVGDRSDDTTVLVTDLASGWIPPGIEIPSAVALLEPGRRRGDLETLLGEVKLAAATEPGHYLPDPADDEPVPTSPRPRQAPEVEELGWQLIEATRWRDGLTRLAHTLARAASKNTGVLESEAEALHDQLTELADRVLNSYPEHVDPDEVGNWQLLAAIEALVAGDKNAANYHLAWFLVCNTAAAESVAR